MSEFRVKISELTKESENIAETSSLMKTYAGNIGSAATALGYDSEMIKMLIALRKCERQTEQHSLRLSKYADSLNECLNWYRNTEDRIVGTDHGNYKINDKKTDSWTDKIKDWFDGLSDEDKKRYLWDLFLMLSPNGSSNVMWNELISYITTHNDYFSKSMRQAIFGDFCEDSTALGVALSVGIGLIPYVGTAADIRDLVADVYNLVKGGPTVDEWVALSFTLIGFIPAMGDVAKHGDDAAGTVKSLAKLYPNLSKKISQLLEGVDKVYNKEAMKNLTEEIDNIYKNVNRPAYKDIKACLGEIGKSTEKIPGRKAIVDFIRNNSKLSDSGKKLADTYCKELLSKVLDDAAEDSISKKLNAYLNEINWQGKLVGSLYSGIAAAQ